jgi:hypothetical protein
MIHDYISRITTLAKLSALRNLVEILKKGGKEVILVVCLACPRGKDSSFIL